MQIVRIILAVFLLGGCASSSAPTQYYLMNPAVDLEVASQTETSLAVGPVLVADYLQRNGLAERCTAHQLYFSSTHLWAAPLQQQLPMLLRQSLQEMLPNARLSSFPSNLPVANRANFQLIVELLKFDGQRGGEVQIVANWQLQDRQTASTAAQGVFSAKQATAGSSYAELVAAHNRLFDQFSQHLADKLAQKIHES